MGILSDLIRAPIGQAPSRGRGMGAIGARPDLPMPPKRRRKGGLAGLLQRVKDKRLERPISIGDGGGGFLKRAARNVNQQVGSQSGTMLPIMPPSIPGLNIPNVGGPALLPGGPVPISNLLPPKSDDFMSIDRVGDDRTAFENQLRPQRPTDFATVESAPSRSLKSRMFTNTDIDKQRALLQAQNIDMTGGLGSNNFLTNRIGDGGTSIANDGTLGDLPPELRIKEQLDSNDSDRFYRNVEPIRPDLLPPINQRRPIIDPRIGMPPPPLPPQDFGFGPGIRPTEIRGPDGRIIGSAGVTPPDSRVDDFVATTGQEVFDKDYFDRIGIPDPRTNIGGINPPPTPDVGLAQPAPVTTSVTDPIVPTVDPVQPAPTEPAAVAPTAGADPTQTQMPMGAIDPVLLQQQTSEKLTDPLLRSLYFGTQDQPGFYQQLQQAGANLIGSDVPLQQTAGLTPLEVLARQQAISGIGGFEPFLQQNQNLVNQAIDQSVRAEELRDPYYGRAERQMQMGLGEELGGIGQARGITTGATNRFGGSLGRLGRQAIGSTQDYGGSLGESEDLLRGTLGAYDPGMTQQFYNPYEDAVVQQTIDDVLEAGDKQDIAARAREISSGAFGGSRARLGAEERRQDLGEGLAKALSGIRQTGYSQAQQTGLSEFARQREAERAASSGLAGLSGSRLGAQQQLGSTLRGLTGDQFGAQQQLAANLMGYGAAGSGARQNLATGLLGIGQQRGAGASALGSQLAGYGSQIGGIGQTQEQMRAGQRGELSGYGGIGRGIQETGLSRIFEQQVGQQYRPMQTLGQIGSMLPGYQASQTQIDSGYGMPTDPSAAGLGAAFSAYGALAPRQGQT